MGAQDEKIARNNSTFREANELIEDAAVEQGLEDGRPVPFICECSDPRCTTIVSLTLAEYRRVRGNPRWFTHAAGHEETVPGSVRLVERHDRYVLVEKVGEAGELVTDLASSPES